MDEDERDERFKRMGFKPQKEKIYNKLLPYADKLDEESSKLFADIKTNLVKSVLAREMRPGCALWTSRLNKYIKVYGMKFSKTDHILLIKLYYDLMTIPYLEPTRINKFAATLSLLLKKRYLLSQEDLQLEWRPLYDLCVRVMEKSKTDIGMYRYYSTLETTIENLIRYARVYFPVTATQEVLDEFRPKLCPYSNSDISAGIEYIELFIPIIVRPEDAHLGYNLWFEEFMNLWEVCHNANVWENQMMWLMARLSNHNIGLINWEPYIPIMFVRFLRTLHLPVGYRQKQSGKPYKIDTSAIAIWIVCALGGQNETAFFHLEKFMQTLESYFHPANTGRWTPKIREFLRKMSFYFIQRVHFERFKEVSWENNTPESCKLTDADIDRFVNIMKPSVEQAIFSRQGSQDVSFALQYLSALRPNIICPIVLEKIYASMDSLTEPHRLTSSMMCLNAISRYLVQGNRINYPEGPTHVMPLLMALLPGIDPNDIRKTLMTFNFITHFVNMVPLVNSSQACTYFDDLTEEEHIVCEASAGFEDFVLQLFDRLCVWVESNSLEFTRMEQTDQDRKSKSETMAEGALLSVITTVLAQCSPEIFQAALRKMYNFATNRILEHKVSGNMVATICQAFARINPKETMKLFMPHLCDTVESLLTEIGDIENEEQLNDELLYNLLLLSQIVDARDELVYYVDRLSVILDKTLHIKSVKGSQMAAHMLTVMMTSLTLLLPIEHRSTNKPLDLHIKDNLTIRQWGAPGNLNDLNISWYVPNEREIACVQSLLNKYLIPELKRLETFCTGEEPLSRETLRRSLKIITAVLGCQTVLPQWDEPALQLVDSCIDPWVFQLIVNVNNSNSVALPDGGNVRKVVVDTLHNVQKKILEVDEGDTKSIQAIISIYDTLLFNKFKSRDFESQWKNFHVLKRFLEDRLHQQKMHLRFVLIHRVMLHQAFRNESRSCSFSETHRQIILDLFELGVSRYSEVRSMAQNRLFNAVSTFAYSYTVLIPGIKEILKVDSTEQHERFKGCLYILLGPKSSPIATRHDWKFLSELWPMLVLSKPSEKPSIVNLMNSLMDSVHRFFPTIAINLHIPEQCLKFAGDLCSSAPVVEFDNVQDIIAKGLEMLPRDCEEKKMYYNETIEQLLNSCINGNLHWRYFSMAISFIRSLVHPDVKYSPRVVQFFLKSLNNESIAIRKIALKVALFIVIQNKPKFLKVAIDPYEFGGKVCEKPVPGIRADNMWLLYNSKTIPKNEAEWDSPRFVHNQYMGFYTWPKQLHVYAPASQQPSAAKRMDNLTPQEEEIFAFFSNAGNIDMLIKYLSMEEKKGKDLFNSYRFLLFKNLFKTFEDKLLPVFLPHLERLVQDKQENYQRCAAEIISGIIRGSNHWSYENVEKLWNILIPILRIAFSNMSDETVGDWGACIAMGLESRDPNRHHWLLEFLMDNPLAEQSSFIGCGRIYILQSALNQQPWRNAELIHRLLAYFQNHMTHPFQNVREKISSCLTSVFCKDLVFPNGNVTNCPRVVDFFAEVMPKLNILYENTLKKLEHSNDTANHSDLEKAARKLEVVSLSDDDKESSIRLFKIVCKYVTGSVVRINYSAVPEHYKLLPLACVLQSNDTDDELETVCTNFLAVLSHTLILDRYVPAALGAVRNVASCPFWSARAVIAEFIPVFVFHNMATIITEPLWISEVQNIVLQLLEDVQPEVRVKASHVLSDLLHCQFIPNPFVLLGEFKRKSKTKLKRRDLTRNSDASTTNSVRLRHSGVLGLCAFITSHPYDVPDYLPEIFSELGPHLSDPQPIPATIRKTLGDFKRTHHDNWEAHKLKFTEEELSVLSDLTVPPSYYA